MFGSKPRFESEGSWNTKVAHQLNKPNTFQILTQLLSTKIWKELDRFLLRTLKTFLIVNSRHSFYSENHEVGS